MLMLLFLVWHLSTWKDDIDSDAELAELFGRRLGEPNHARLARRVVCLNPPEDSFSVFLTQNLSEIHVFKVSEWSLTWPMLPVLPTMLAMLTMLPASFCSFIRLAAVCVTRNVPFRFTSITCTLISISRRHHPQTNAEIHRWSLCAISHIFK